MAVIRRADAEQFARDAVVLDLGRLEAQGEALVVMARKRAEQIVAEARAERERLIADAAAVGHEEGLATGRVMGLEQGRAEGHAEALAEAGKQIAALEAAWSAALDEFIAARADMLGDAREDLVRLACEIARRVTGRTVEQHPEVVAEQLADVLGVVVQSTTLRVRVHPDDEPFVTEALPVLRARFTSAAAIELVMDAGIGRGSCIADTERRGTIDASIQTKLERLIDAIMPGADR